MSRLSSLQALGISNERANSEYRLDGFSRHGLTSAWSLVNLPLTNKTSVMIYAFKLFLRLVSKRKGSLFTNTTPHRIYYITSPQSPNKRRQWSGITPHHSRRQRYLLCRNSTRHWVRTCALSPHAVHLGKSLWRARVVAGKRTQSELIIACARSYSSVVNIWQSRISIKGLFVCT